jgi:hypothetical protein
MGGLSGANANCNTLAGAAGVPGKFVAFLGTSTQSAFANLGSARGWVRPDGLPFTDTVANFQNNNVMWYPPIYSETMSIPTTGVFFTGARTTNTCSDWTSATDMAVGGDNPYSAMAYFFNIDGFSCASETYLCFGTDFNSQVSVTPVAGRRLFTSSEGFDPSKGVGAADTLCQNEASAAGLANPTHFLALLSTTTTAAQSRFNMNGTPWVRTDGVLAASTTANFMAGNFTASPSVTQTGAYSPTNYAWVGSKAGPSAVAASTQEDCNNWTDTTSSYNAAFLPPTYGAPNAWSAFSTIGCDWAPSGSGTHAQVFCLEN